MSRAVTPLVAVTLTALTAACSLGGTTPEATTSRAPSPSPSATTGSPSALPPSPKPSWRDNLIVTAPPGTRVIHAAVHGQGSGEVGTVAVPQRYGVVVACAGTGKLAVEVDSEPVLTTTCGETPDSFVVVVNRPGGRTSARIDIRCDSQTRWAAVVTSDPL